MNSIGDHIIVNSMKILLILIFTTQAYANELYKKVFPTYNKALSSRMPDPIGEAPVNTTLLKVFKDKKLLGYIREITTSTGCHSACLPVIYTSFYNGKGELIKLLSKDGLTKIGHAPFTPEDHAKLELILAMAPTEFDQIKHPKELTDAISGETFKKFENIVVRGGAYSTLRVHLYNQHTSKWIQGLGEKK